MEFSGIFQILWSVTSGHEQLSFFGGLFGLVECCCWKFRKIYWQLLHESNGSWVMNNIPQSTQFFRTNRLPLLGRINRRQSGQRARLRTVEKNAKILFFMFIIILTEWNKIWFDTYYPNSVIIHCRWKRWPHFKWTRSDFHASRHIPHSIFLRIRVGLTEFNQLQFDIRC